MSGRKKNKGFTLIEGVIVMAIIAILFGLASPYLLGNKEKNLLDTEREKVANQLRVAKQKAIGAYGGYDYKVIFDLGGQQVRINPGGPTVSLPTSIEITDASPLEVTFLRISGEPNSSLGVTLESKRFRCQISLSEEGIIESTFPERR
ncbi:Tfp pilus assembly protein FimT/FimU [Patescibacteria group bacterium]